MGRNRLRWPSCRPPRRTRRGFLRRRCAQPDQLGALIESLEDRTLLEVVAPDLVAFAQALTNAGAKLYGASWDAFTTSQRQLFEDGAPWLPFIEVTNPDHTPNAIAAANNIQITPTWIFADGTRLEGVQTLEAISQASGIAIPTSAQPSFVPIPDGTLLAGSPVFLELDGYDPNGGPLTFTVTSDNPDLVEATVLADSPSLRISVAGYGEMVIQLFDHLVPRVTQRVTQLAEAGFYDGLLFHQVTNGVSILGGDPTGTGGGGSALGPFDDQFHPDLQFNRTGLVGMARGLDDTNDSQFFITEGAQRQIDFDRSLFGLLVEGEMVREAISNTATTVNGRPLFDIVMQQVTVFSDIENAVLMLKAPEGATGTANITVTVTDPEGNSFQQTFRADVVPDPINSDPFLADVPAIVTGVDTPVTVQLTAVDVEGDAVTFLDENALNAFGLYIPLVSDPNLDYSVDPNTGLLTITPKNGLTGTHSISVAVGVVPDSARLDYQVIPVTIIEAGGSFTISSADHPAASQADDGLADTFRLHRNGDNLELLINDAVAAVVPAAAPQLVLDGSGDADTFIIDFSGGNPIPAEGLVVRGQGQPAEGDGDSLQLVGGAAQNVVYTFANASDGSIAIDGVTVTYTGLEPIRDELTATERRFVFGDADDVITLDAGPAADDGTSRLSSESSSETVEFANPTGTLLIDAAGGNDRVML
ncbi:MAG: peptidylprolyl isomerase, partial [Planctomycetes bacterium]|nr:peptidylprolyl isomerase [Planctomycetota bacterium]